MDRSFFQSETRLPEGVMLHPQKTAAKICLGYAAAGWLWILSSDYLVAFMTPNPETRVVLSSLKGSLFIFVTAGILYLLVYSQLRQIWKAQVRYAQSAEELESAHEELTASDEELRQQFDELTIKANLIEEKDREIWALFEYMHDAFAVCETIFDDQEKPVDYRIMNTNHSFESLVGRVRGELIGNRLLEVFPEAAGVFFAACVEVTLSGIAKKLTFFSELLGKYLAVSIYSPSHGQLAIMAMDITAEKTHENTVERLAYYDGLTGLPNRLKLTDALRQELESGQGTIQGGTLLYIDMDDLKLVNDSYGHSYGDAMIITAATHLVSLSESGSLVARVGSDEFIILIPGMNDSGKAEKMATEVVKTLNCEYEVKEVRFHASASLGLVMYPQDGKTVEEILMNADTALYEAKRNGKQCWRFFRQAMKEIAYGNMQLINGLRNAVVNEELEVHYQPQISLRDGSVIAFEALLRWNSPRHGNVSPAQFIPLAEKSNLIESIGAWVVKEACGFSRKLTQAGYPGVRVAVNVSPRQLIAADFLDIIQASFQEAELAVGRLEIEITETVFMDSMDESVPKLNKLRALGVHLSLDDFGTGYSSLTYLRSLPVHTVKIDKSFIDLISTDTERAALIASIIEMAHVLGLSVVAEGVETTEQLEKLIQYRCDMIQGYLVSKAVPDSVALKILSERTWPDRIKKVLQ